MTAWRNGCKSYILIPSTSQFLTSILRLSNRSGEPNDFANTICTRGSLAFGILEAFDTFLQQCTPSTGQPDEPEQVNQISVTPRDQASPSVLVNHAIVNPTIVPTDSPIIIPTGPAIVSTDSPITVPTGSPAIVPIDPPAIASADGPAIPLIVNPANTLTANPVDNPTPGPATNTINPVSDPTPISPVVANLTLEPVAKPTLDPAIEATNIAVKQVSVGEPGAESVTNLLSHSNQNLVARQKKRRRPQDSPSLSPRNTCQGTKTKRTQKRGSKFWEYVPIDSGDESADDLTIATMDGLGSNVDDSGVRRSKRHKVV